MHTHTKAKAAGLPGFDQVSKRIQYRVLYSLVRKTPWWKGVRVSEFESCRAVRCNIETGRDPQALEPHHPDPISLERQDMGRGRRDEDP